MNTRFGLDQCLTFIHCNLDPASTRAARLPATRRWRAITLSRQAGAGGNEAALCLAPRLGGAGPAWTVLDRNLVEKVLEEHHLPQRLARFMPEDRLPHVDDALDELLGVHPPSHELVQMTSETIHRLAESGQVVLIDRAANIVTRDLNHVLHVRLIGSLDKRVERVQKLQNMDRDAALALIHRVDRGRQRYVRNYFDRDINDPLLYHLVINTDQLDGEQVAKIIAGVALN